MLVTLFKSCRKFYRDSFEHQFLSMFFLPSYFATHPEAGANSRAMDHLLETPLHAAAEAGRPDCVQVLLEHGANVNQAQEGGLTALHMAARHGHLDVLQLLLDAGAHMEVKDHAGANLLHTAAENGQVENAKQMMGHPVDWCVFKGYFTMVEE